MKKTQPQNPPSTFATRLIVSILILFGLLVISTVVAFIMSGDNTLADANTALITISGPITGDSDTGIWSAQSASSTEIVRELEQARDDSKIKAIILEINSPGGSPVATDEIAQAVKDARAHNKTVVAWIREEGASGGYWIASSSDHIVANRMSITGSIGVYGSYMQFDKFLQDWNVSYNRLVAGERKDIGDPFVNLDDAKRDFLQRKLDKLHMFFIEEVAHNRNMSVKDVQMLADGRIFLGVEAKEEGLVDELGGKPEAVAYVKRKIGADVTIVEYAPKKTFMEELFGVVSPQRTPTLEQLAQQRAVDANTLDLALR
jgi:protease-4